jgi:hypothetical protein
MSDVKCASCGAVLAHRELDEGWCDGCGKAIPLFVYHQNGLKGPKGHALPQDVPRPATRSAAPSAVMDPEEKIPLWQVAVIAVFLIGIAVVIVRALV